LKNDKWGFKQKMKGTKSWGEFGGEGKKKRRVLNQRETAIVVGRNVKVLGEKMG